MDCLYKVGTHWFTNFDISPASNFLHLDTFGTEGLKNFIIQDNKNIMEKVNNGQKGQQIDSRQTKVFSEKLLGTKRHRKIVAV